MKGKAKNFKPLPFLEMTQLETETEETPGIKQTQAAPDEGQPEGFMRPLPVSSTRPKSYEVLRDYLDENRERRNVRITTCLTPSVHMRLKELAAKSRNSVNNIIHMIIEQYLEYIDRGELK